MNKSIVNKYVISNLVDLVVPAIPLTYFYFYQKLTIFEYLEFFELLGIVYLVFNLIAYIRINGNTIGGNLTKLLLIDINSDRKNHFKNIIRIFVISGFIFYLHSIQDFKFSIFMALLFLIIPVKFSIKNDFCYSVLNRFLTLKYKII